MVEFVKAYAPWNKPKFIPSATGSDEVEELQAVLKDGSYVLEPTGKKVNIQNKIQSHANDCDLSLILASMMDAGIDLSNGISLSDDIDDYTDFQSKSVHDRLEAVKNYEKNLEYYQKEIERLKAEAEAKGSTENGGENNGE